MKRAALWFSVLILMAACYGLQRSIDSNGREESSPFLWSTPSGEFLKLAGFGFKEVAADYLWVKALLYVAAQFDREKREYGQLWGAFDAITDLDKGFAAAYHSGAMYLAALAKEPEKGITLLKKGLRTNDQDWRFRWLLNYDIGISYSYYLGDQQSSLPYFKAAAEDPFCPPATTAFIVRIVSAKAVERYKAAFEIWKERWETARGPIMRKLAEEEMKKAQSKVYMAELEDAVKAFEKKAGRKPRTLDELVENGLIGAVPEDPLGGKFGIGEAGDIIRSGKE